jgi:hypothetical protein
MAENKLGSSSGLSAGHHFKEAVCINAGRIYDSCADKDCLEDLRLLFTPQEQAKIDNAVNIKSKFVCIEDVCIDVEPIPFNKGFYSVDITYYFNVVLDVFTCVGSPCTTVDGFAVFNKRVILYGSEGNVKIFTSTGSGGCGTYGPATNMPKAIVQVVDPILLAARLVDVKDCHYDPVVTIPRNIAERHNCECDTFADRPEKMVLVTLGLFSIVQIERKVQMLIPAYDFCIPDKECTSSSDDPCEIFENIKFPIDDFFPPKLSESGCEGKSFSD